MAHNITNLISNSGDLKRKATVLGGMIVGGLITAAVTHRGNSTVVRGTVVPDVVADEPATEPTTETE